MSYITFTKVRLAYGWLGNMSPHRIWYDETYWPTSEHLFQALRFSQGSPERDKILSEKSPMAAKLAAKSMLAHATIEPRSAQDLDNMRLCLRLKIEQHPDLRTQLLATGDANIIEDVAKRQNVSGLFWGMAAQPDGTWKGDNWLGKLWVELRSSLRST